MAKPLTSLACLLLALLASPDAQAGADPMAPPVRHATAAASGGNGQPAAAPFTPGTLLWTQVGTPTPYAWYDGRLVQPGDRLENAQVLAIADDHILVRSRGRRYRVPLLSVPIHSETTATPAHPR